MIATVEAKNTMAMVDDAIAAWEIKQNAQQTRESDGPS